MKITTEQLSTQLAKKSYPIFLVSGDEPLLVEETIGQIRQTVQRDNAFDRKVYHVDTHFDWSKSLESIKNLSLFAEKTLIELRISSGKINETGQKFLINYLENPSKDKTLLLITPKPDSSSQKTKWFKAVDQSGIFIPIWPLTLKQMPFWIRQRLQRHQMSADSNAVQLIIEHVEGNLLAANQEIEKLKLIYDKKHLTTDDVISVIGDNTRYNIFTLTDASLEGDVKRTLRILNKLQGEGIEPILILWALTREIRNLIEIVQQIENGQPIEKVFSQKSIRDKQKPLIHASIKRLNSQSLLNLLSKAAQIDRTIKGLTTGNIWDELKSLSLGLCGH